MAINKVEYILNSSTSGFAVAGDEVTISKSNAQTVQKDVNEGNTEDLDAGQTRFLNYTVKHSNDNVEYDGEINPNELDNDGNPIKGKGKGSGENHVGDAAGTTLAAGGAAAGAVLGVAAMGKAIVAEGSNMIIESMNKQLGTNLPKMNAVTAPVIGAIDLAGGALSLVYASKFDSNYNERLANYAMSDDSINSINSQLDVLNQDIATLTPLVQSQSEKPAPAEGAESGEQDEGAALLAEQLEELNNQLAECEKNGDTAGARAIKQQIKELQSNSNSNKTEENPEVMAAEQNGSAAETVVDFGQNVASVLKEGNTMGAMAAVNAAAFTACTAISGIMAVKAWLGNNLFTLPGAIVGAALCTEATILFAGSTALMIKKSVKEFQCGKKSRDVQDAINNSQDIVAQHKDLVTSLQQSSEESESAPVDIQTPPETTGGNTSGGTSSSSSGGTEGTSSGGGVSSGGSSAGGTSSGSSSSSGTNA